MVRAIYWDKSTSWFLKILKLSSFYLGNFKIFKYALGQFILNRPPKHMTTTSTNVITSINKWDMFLCTYSCTPLIFVGVPTWQSLALTEGLRVLVSCYTVYYVYTLSLVLWNLSCLLKLLLENQENKKYNKVPSACIAIEILWIKKKYNLVLNSPNLTAHASKSGIS